MSFGGLNMNTKGQNAMLHFVYNPSAGNGKAERARAAIQPLLDGLSIEYTFHETHGMHEAISIARRLSMKNHGALDIVAMGGDGTVNEVLNGLVDPARARLGVIPCGSGNDFAAAAGIPTAPEAALDVILHGEAKPTDYMECSGVRGINAIGTGIDVDILRRYARMKVLKGSAAYLASLIINLFGYRARRFTEETGGAAIPHNALIACAGNGKSIGGGIPICPDAAIDDGLLDIVIVDDVPRASIPGAFLKLMKRRIREVPTARFARRDALRIRSDAPMPIQIDGEIYEDLPFDVKLIHGVLRVYRP